MTAIEPREFLMIPGPTPVPDAILEAHARHPLGHRSKEFAQYLRQGLDGLKWLGESEQEPLILTASGTAGMESAIANTINKGDHVLSLVCGVFGERFAGLCQAYGAEVERLQVEPGRAITPEAVEERLSRDRDKSIKAITITHNETSTGVINDLEKISRIVRAHGALILVDAVTSFGVTKLPIDEWQLDIVVTGSQKALMLPPGLAIVFVSDKAWQATKSCNNPRFYLDFAKYRKAQSKDQTPFTPAVNLIRALSVSLALMKEEGKENIFSRHIRLKEMLRASLPALSLQPFTEETAASPAITSILPPKAISVADLRQSLKSRFGIVVADGQEDLKGKIFRIGHMGYVFERDLGMTIHALATILKEHNG